MLALPGEKLPEVDVGPAETAATATPVDHSRTSDPAPAIANPTPQQTALMLQLRQMMMAQQAAANVQRPDLPIFYPPAFQAYNVPPSMMQSVPLGFNYYHASALGPATPNMYYSLRMPMFSLAAYNTASMS
jgi:hypothetical protein